MSGNGFILLGYSIFLLIILVINLLYFFQVFKYRLPGDASLIVVSLHLSLIILTLVISGFFISTS